MAKDPLDIKKYIPEFKPDELQVKAPKLQKETEKEIDITILRRTKIRELRRMGYEDPKQISLVLDKGIVDKNGKTIRIPCTPYLIKKDLEYLTQEDISRDDSFAAKRVELLDKLRFLYRRAYQESANARGPVKNAFLSTAFSILKAIIHMEGALIPSNQSVVPEDVQLMTSAKTLRELSDEDKKRVITALKSVVERDKDTGSVEKANIPSGKRRISASVSNDERISRKREVHTKRGQIKTPQQKSTN